ncbi:hypothetical protein, partial [Pseudonocardia sp.]|uniref:hypothetical protein n=1 Tax=Pseudonocardia sp. TaxID=60912 RepID=UPI002608D20D
SAIASVAAARTGGVASAAVPSLASTELDIVHPLTGHDVRDRHRADGTGRLPRASGRPAAAPTPPGSTAGV